MGPSPRQRSSNVMDGLQNKEGLGKEQRKCESYMALQQSIEGIRWLSSKAALVIQLFSHRKCVFLRGPCFIRVVKILSVSPGEISGWPSIGINSEGKLCHPMSL